LARSNVAPFLPKRSLFRTLSRIPRKQSIASIEDFDFCA
jgi:hypothetical protein